MKCSDCAIEKTTGGERIPMGWHRRRDSIYCGKCWGNRYVLRAVTFPVVGTIDGDWTSLRKALADAWADSTSLANWSVTELAKNDALRQVGDKKCPKMPAIYLYGLAKKTYCGWSRWSGSYASAQSVMRAAEQKYRSSRFATIWTRERSLLSFRYPFPYPIHNQNWTAEMIQQRPTVSFAISGGKITLVLKGGHEMRRQLESFAEIECGDATKGEMAIYRVRANPGDHRQGVSEVGRSSPRGHYRVMVKLVAWLPRKEKISEGCKTYSISAAKDSFLIAEDGWKLNSDFMRAAVANHRVFLDRMAEDTKHEKRWPKRKLRNIKEFRAARCLKQNNRLKTFCQQVAAMVAGRAKRKGCASITLDDSERGYFAEGFCWAQFRVCLTKAADDLGMIFVSSGDVVDETMESARNE